MVLAYHFVYFLHLYLTDAVTHSRRTTRQGTKNTNQVAELLPLTCLTAFLLPHPASSGYGRRLLGEWWVEHLCGKPSIQAGASARSLVIPCQRNTQKPWYNRNRLMR